MDDCTKITEHFLTELPKLLSKVGGLVYNDHQIFSTDVFFFFFKSLFFLFVQFSGHCDAVASLMKIPQFFVPDCPVDDITQVCP